jgi:hypothetical protein
LAWPNINISGVEYDLSHLRSREFTYIRPSNQKKSERPIRFFLSFSDHCFTEHYGEHIYPYSPGDEERFFCEVRYEHSKHIFDLIKKLISENLHIQRTFNSHREQFYYLEEHYQNTEYRLFLELSKSSHPNSDLRIKVVSAYEPRTSSSPVCGQSWHKFLSIVDARINGVSLTNKKRR